MHWPRKCFQFSVISKCLFSSEKKKEFNLKQPSYSFLIWFIGMIKNKEEREDIIYIPSITNLHKLKKWKKKKKHVTSRSIYEHFHKLLPFYAVETEELNSTYRQRSSCF